LGGIVNWKFYIDPNANSDNPYIKWRSGGVLMASNEIGGYFIDKNGRFIDGEKLSPHFSIRSHGGWKSVPLSEAVKLIDKSVRAKVFRHIGISISETPIVITDEIKNNVLSILTKRRAFNGDSAHTFTENEFNNLEILDALAEQGIIKTLDGQKYWIETEEEKKENQIELKLDAKSTIKGVMVNGVIMDEIPW
jgi:hypothetical protein